jgi:hypothetical protein
MALLILRWCSTLTAFKDSKSSCKTEQLVLTVLAHSRRTLLGKVQKTGIKAEEPLKTIRPKSLPESPTLLFNNRTPFLFWTKSSLGPQVNAVAKKAGCQLLLSPPWSLWKIICLVFCFCFWDRVLLCRPGWIQTVNFPASVSWVLLGLQAYQVYTTKPSFFFFFFEWVTGYWTQSLISLSYTLAPFALICTFCEQKNPFVPELYPDT